MNNKYQKIIECYGKLTAAKTVLADHIVSVLEDAGYSNVKFVEMHSSAKKDSMTIVINLGSE